ncbi:YlbF family regulator [Gorillibacterium sp. sgz5001074]|uniref:YlbF family regulator n=1 Tax=Gorillibacterium sp. sgz5001074 TaxID=3446695 RepID=UPI003F67EA59
MSVMERTALDMSALLLGAYELGDMILASGEAADYLQWKKAMAEDPAAQELIRKLQKQKDLFEECQRFGHFHPEYHKAMDAVRAVQEELDGVESVRRFKEAEERLDDLLYEVSETIARSVSDSIKVPTNKLLPESGGCSSGGSCSGKCG